MAQGERSYLTPNASAYRGFAVVRSNLAVPFKEALETTPTTDAGLAALLDLLIPA
jgi:hypothetical protein